MSTPKLPGAGGSYTRDPESQKLTRTEGTDPAPVRGAKPEAKPKPAAKRGQKKEG